MRKHRKLILGVVLAALWQSAPALAAPEVEPNDVITAAQPLRIGSDGSATVEGVLGVLTGAAVSDVDFYSFEGKEGDVVDVDIDNGIKLPSNGRSLDTILTIFGPGPAFKKLRENDDALLPLPIDPGSISRSDARIVAFRLPATATYTIAVTNFPRFMRDGGILTSTSLGSEANGAYTLIVSGVTPSVQQINIEVKPGSGDHAPINLKSKGNIPVALLGSAEFDPRSIDPASVTFGHTGNEQSLQRCHLDGEDVNGDGRADVVCQFENQDARFESSDVEGILRGKTKDGRAFEGRAPLKVVSGKRK